MTSSAWITDPSQAHRTWRDRLTVATREYAQHSTSLYVSLFGKFCRWMATQECSLATLNEGKLSQFCESLQGRHGGPASDRTQRMYLGEISRVMDHLVDIGLRQDNPARAIVTVMRSRSPLKPRAIFVTRPDTRRIYTDHLDGKDPSAMGADGVRSHAMAMLMLDTGMTLKELQKITLAQVRWTDAGDKGQRLEVTAPGHRLLQPRTVVLSATGTKWLGAWLVKRESMRVIKFSQYKAFEGVSSAARAAKLKAAAPHEIAPHLSRVFVMLAGKANRTQSALREMSLAINRIKPDLIYEAAERVFWLAANQDGESKDMSELRFRGPQTIRNLYGAGLLARGLSNEEVAYRMGLLSFDQIWALKRTMPGLGGA